MKLFAVCGSPIRNSISPIIYRQLLENNYIDGYYSRILTYDAEEAIALFDELHLSGMNITTPLKQPITKYCDNTTNEVKIIGNVNTVVEFENQKLGFNTDWEGVLTSINNFSNENNLKNKTIENNILIIGAGASASAAIFGIKQIYPKSNIVLLNRSKGNAMNLANKFSINYIHNEASEKLELVQFNIIVITIPNFSEYLNNIIFRNDAIILFSNYSDRKSINNYKKKYINIIPGEEWLKNQAFPAFEYFTKNDDICKKIDLPETIINDYYDNFNRSNIYLIGFIGAGKSSIGREFAKLLNRNFIDLDEVIEIRNNKSINYIFQNEGEEQFRKYETEALSIITKSKNSIISLGGGTILNPINHSLIAKNNGYIIYIFSKLEHSLCRINISQKPILANKNHTAIEELFQYRKEKYFTSSDLVVANNSMPIETTINKLVKDFK